MKKDFFSRVRASQKHHFLITGVFAFMLSLGIVATYHGDITNLGGLSASVIRSGEVGKSDIADLIVEKTGQNINIRMGNSAEKVDTVSVMLIGDPDRFTTLMTDNVMTSIESKAPGMFHIRVDMHGRSLSSGEIITTLRLHTGEVGSITPIEARFTSQGVEYTLSVKG